MITPINSLCMDQPSSIRHTGQVVLLPNQFSMHVLWNWWWQGSSLSNSFSKHIEHSISGSIPSLGWTAARAFSLFRSSPLMFGRRPVKQLISTTRQQQAQQAHTASTSNVPRYRCANEISISTRLIRSVIVQLSLVKRNMLPKMNSIALRQLSSNSQNVLPICTIP